MKYSTVFTAVIGSLVFLTAPPPQAQAGCGSHAIGLARSIGISGAGGPKYGRAGGGRQLPLRSHEIVLTFDDGPIASKTSSVLRTLRKHCTRATFFLAGSMARHNPGMIRRIARSGHTVGTHSWRHINLSRLPLSQGIGQIRKGFQVSARALGGRIAPFFRYPGLNGSSQMRAILRKRNIATISIDIDSQDWKGQSGEGMLKTILGQLKYRRHKGIILFHDINPRTVRSLDYILTNLKKKGYRVVHLRPTRKINMAQINAIKAGGQGIAMAMTQKAKKKYKKTRYRRRMAALQRRKKRLRRKHYQARGKKYARLRRYYRPTRYKRRKKLRRHHRKYFAQRRRYRKTYRASRRNKLARNRYYARRKSRALRHSRYRKTAHRPRINRYRRRRG